MEGYFDVAALNSDCLLAFDATSKGRLKSNFNSSKGIVPASSLQNFSITRYWNDAMSEALDLATNNNDWKFEISVKQLSSSSSFIWRHATSTPYSNNMFIMLWSDASNNIFVRLYDKGEMIIPSNLITNFSDPVDLIVEAQKNGTNYTLQAWAYGIKKLDLSVEYSTTTTDVVYDNGQINTIYSSGNFSIEYVKITDLTEDKIVWQYPRSFEEKTQLLTYNNTIIKDGYFTSAADLPWTIATKLPVITDDYTILVKDAETIHAQTRQGSTIINYQNGIAGNYTLPFFRIATSDFSGAVNSKMAAAMVFERCLTADEIKILSSLK